MQVPEAFRHPPGGRGGNSNDAKIIRKSLKLLGVLLAGVVTGMMLLGIFNLYLLSFSPTGYSRPGLA